MLAAQFASLIETGGSSEFVHVAEMLFGLEEWRSHKDVLATSLKPDVWNALAVAYLHAELQAQTLAETTPGAFSKDDIEGFERAAASLDEAAEVLMAAAPVKD